MARQRHFKPRSPIPKDTLLKDLEKGLTLQEIGDKYDKARSTISEMCAMYNIDVDNVQDGKQNMLKRKKSKVQKTFISVMYDKIKKEL